MNSNTFTDVCQVSRWKWISYQHDFSMFLPVCVHRCSSCQRAYLEPARFHHPSFRASSPRRKRKIGFLLATPALRVSLSTHLFICLSVSSAPVSLLTYISADLTFQPFYPSIHLPACCSVSLFAWPVGSQLSLRESLSNASYVVFILYIIW